MFLHSVFREDYSVTLCSFLGTADPGAAEEGVPIYIVD